MAGVGRKPSSPSIPGEYNRGRNGVHFPAETTSSAITQPVPPTFANRAQTIVGFETVNLTFTVGPLQQGQSATIEADAPAYFKDQGSVKLSPTDTGKIVLMPSAAPMIPNGVVSGPTLTLSARGGTIAKDGTLSSGTSYSQIAVNGSIQVYATGLVGTGKITVPITAQLVGASVV